ncbi:MAG: hypothetical protein ACYSSN_11810 [Planctomycetota bacterium]
MRTPLTITYKITTEDSQRKRRQDSTTSDGNEIHISRPNNTPSRQTYGRFRTPTSQMAASIQQTGTKWFI